MLTVICELLLFYRKPFRGKDDLSEKILSCFSLIIIALSLASCANLKESASSALSQEIPNSENIKVSASHKITTENNSEITDEPTTDNSTTDAQTTIPITHGPSDIPEHLKWAILNFNSLREYEKTLTTFKSDDAIYKALLAGSGLSQCRFYKDNFDMMLVDRYFLLPVLPPNSVISRIRLSSRGQTAFDVTLTGGESFYFLYRYDKEPLESITNATNATRTIITNSRGINITHDHVYSSIQNVHYGYYNWQEGEYYCRMAYEGNNIALYDAFVKELSFEKISIDA